MPAETSVTLTRTLRYWLAPSILAIVLAVAAWVGLNVGTHVWADHQMMHAHQTQLQEVIRWINTQINGGTDEPAEDPIAAETPQEDPP